MNQTTLNDNKFPDWRLSPAEIAQEFARRLTFDAPKDMKELGLGDSYGEIKAADFLEGAVPRYAEMIGCDYEEALACTVWHIVHLSGDRERPDAKGIPEWVGRKTKHYPNLRECFRSAHELEGRSATIVSAIIRAHTNMGLEPVV